MIEYDLTKDTFEIDKRGKRNEACLYTTGAFKGLVHHVYNNDFKNTIQITRFGDLKVGDKLYTMNGNKSITEYTITGIIDDLMHIFKTPLYGEGEVYDYGIYKIRNFEFENSQGRKYTFWLFVTDVLETWDGLGLNFGPGIFNGMTMIYPNTAEIATKKKIFSCKEAALGYLQNLRDERLDDVAKAKKEFNKKVHYANEYIDVMKELGWNSEKDSYVQLQKWLNDENIQVKL